MDLDAIIALVEEAVYHHTNKPLTDLQQAILLEVWQGQKYWEIADKYGCTEGHAKDTGSLLWKLLSQVWQIKVTKSNFKRLSKLQLKKIKKAVKEQKYAENSAIAVNNRFLGREKEIIALQDLVARERKIIVIQGEGGIGKTTLAKQFLVRQNFELVLEVLMAKETENTLAAATVVEEWLQRDLHETSSQEFGVNLARLKRYLQQHRVGIAIDNLEPILDRNGRLINERRDYLELLRILADPQVLSSTIVTSRDRLCEGEIDLEHYRLSGLDLTSWQQYFTLYDLDAQNSAISLIRQTYEGNAKAMGIICGIIREDYDGAVSVYWQENGHDPLVETDLKNLVGSQFDRLKQLDEKAYLLLCRLGCYRYQDLAKLPHSGLSCLLWDLPQAQHRRTIKSLRNRSLLECDRGEYWLHPLIRAEAKLRIERSPVAWQTTHRQIAEYLTANIEKIDSIQAGLTALEAYYHYFVVGDYSAAAKVILYSRENQWGQFLTLGTTLYRLGIIQPLLTAIEPLMAIDEDWDDATKSAVADRYRSELNNILGDLYWTAGKIDRAIACQQKTIVTSKNYRSSIPQTTENRYDLYYWKMLEVDSLLSLGLYHIDLWELNTAADLFQQVIDLAHNTKHHSWAEKSALGLALVNSYLTPNLPPHKIVGRLYRFIIDLEDKNYNTGRFAYFMQMLGQIFFNLQQIEPASLIWQRAIAFSSSSHYTQIEAKSLIGLAKIERYHHNCDRALDYHQKAIELLEKIGAKCDLAEAYLQWGITLQKSDLSTESQEFFVRAIELFQQIQAPKQIVRVQKITSQDLVE